MWRITLILISMASGAPTDYNVDFAPINQFTLELLDNTYAFQENFGRKNIAISPLSIWSIFALLAEGSSGETFQELMRELRLPNDIKATQALHSAISYITKMRNQDVVLNGQSAMFADKALHIHQEFCQSANYYSSDVFSVDPSNTTKLADDINYYICIATEGRILEAVKPDVLQNLKMILLNVLYFKASWTYPFDQTQTKEEVFYNSQGKPIGTVNMMIHKAPHNRIDSDLIGAQVLEMTYGKNEQFSMIILVPYNDMPLKMLLSNLAKQPLSWMEDLRFFGSLEDTISFIPRFRILSETNLIPPLRYSGIQRIFDAQKAELPGVSDSSLFVSQTIQNVELEVTEEGTVAASATIVGLKDRMLGQRFEANREFVFLVIDRKTNVILLSGVYTDPYVV